MGLSINYFSIYSLNLYKTWYVLICTFIWIWNKLYQHLRFWLYRPRSGDVSPSPASTWTRAIFNKPPLASRSEVTLTASSCCSGQRRNNQQRYSSPPYSPIDPCVNRDGQMQWKIIIASNKLMVLWKVNHLQYMGPNCCWASLVLLFDPLYRVWGHFHISDSWTLLYQSANHVIFFKFQKAPLHASWTIPISSWRMFTKSTKLKTDTRHLYLCVWVCVNQIQQRLNA